MGVLIVLPKEVTGGNSFLITPPSLSLYCFDAVTALVVVVLLFGFVVVVVGGGVFVFDGWIAGDGVDLIFDSLTGNTST